VEPKPTSKAFERPTAKLDSAFEALDKAIAPAEPKPATAKPGPPRPAEPKPEPKPAEVETKVEDTEAKPEEAATDKPKDKPVEFDPEQDPFGDDAQTEPEAEQQAQPATEEGRPKVATLRQMLDAEKRTVEKLKKELEKVTKTQKPEELPETVKSELETLRKQQDELLEEIRYTDYSKHPEFKEKYEAPYHRSWNMGRAAVSQIRIKDPQTGDERMGTAKDFDDLMQLHYADPDRAAEMMDVVFGVKAATVSTYMARVNETLMEMNEAKEEFRKKGGDRDKQRQEQVERMQAEIGKSISETWQRNASEPLKRFPEWFQKVDGDEKGNELLDKGFAQAKWAMSHLNAFDPNLTPKERENIVRSHAAMFNKAAAFNRLTYFVRQRDARIAELEKELSQYKGSEPGSGEGAEKSSKDAKQGKNWEAQLDSLARR